MKTRLLLTLFASATLAATAGCPKKPDNKPQVDGDANSGPDGIRSGAVKIEVNKVSLPDDVNFDKQDMTDWKSVELTGKPALLTVELKWDNVNSDLNVDAFDAVGNQIASSPGPSPGTTSKKIVAQIEQVPATYYIRVTAVKAHDTSVYTVEPKWEGDVPVAAVVEEPKEEPKVVKAVVRPHTPSKPKASSAEKIAETGLQGRIVSSYKEGGGMVLHVDKGSAAGVKAGQQGTILDGPNGATPLPGAMFKIETVVDEHKSIARTGLRTLGKNNRVAIDTK